MVRCYQSFDHADLRGRNMSGEDLKGVVFAGKKYWEPTAEK